MQFGSGVPPPFAHAMGGATFQASGAHLKSGKLRFAGVWTTTPQCRSSFLGAWTPRRSRRRDVWPARCRPTRARAHRLPAARLPNACQPRCSPLLQHPGAEGAFGTGAGAGPRCETRSCAHPRAHLPQMARAPCGACLHGAPLRPPIPRLAMRWDHATVPLDLLGCTHATLMRSTSWPKRAL